MVATASLYAPETGLIHRQKKPVPRPDAFTYACRFTYGEPLPPWVGERGRRSCDGQEWPGYRKRGSVHFLKAHAANLKNNLYFCIA